GRATVLPSSGLAPRDSARSSNFSGKALRAAFSRSGVAPTRVGLPEASARPSTTTSADASMDADSFRSGRFRVTTASLLTGSTSGGRVALLDVMRRVGLWAFVVAGLALVTWAVVSLVAPSASCRGVEMHPGDTCSYYARDDTSTERLQTY